MVSKAGLCFESPQTRAIKAVNHLINTIKSKVNKECKCHILKLIFLDQGPSTLPNLTQNTSPFLENCIYCMLSGYNKVKLDTSLRYCKDYCIRPVNYEKIETTRIMIRNTVLGTDNIWIYV